MDIKKSVVYSSAFLIVANLYSVIGILFLGWNTKNIIMLFWLETGIIGFFWAIKILLIKNDYSGKISLKKRIITFVIFSLVISYLFLLSGQGLAYFLNLKVVDDTYKFISYLFSYEFFNSDIVNEVKIAALLIFFSHGFSFFINFIQNKEYAKMQLCWIPFFGESVSFFNRIMALLYASTLAIGLEVISSIIRIFTIEFYYSVAPLSSIFLALLLVLVKGYFDLKIHIKEHSPKEKEERLDSNTLLAELRKSKK